MDVLLSGRKVLSPDMLGSLPAAKGLSVHVYPCIGTSNA